MVLQKRLDYGFNGYQVPATPRATRSARRRGTVRQRVEENQMCAFDLLATVAGKLLLNTESSPSFSNASSEKEQCTNDNQDCQDGKKVLKMEPCDQGGCDRMSLVSELVLQGQDENISTKESSLPQNEIKSEMGSFVSKIEVGSSRDCKLDGEVETLVNETRKVPTANDADMCSSEDPVVWDGEPPTLVSSDSSTKVPFCGDHIPQKSHPESRDDTKVVSRDDDENSSGCTHPNTSTKYFKRVPRIGDRRIRKILASKYWKASPKLKDETLFNPDGDIKPIYRSRKDFYKRQRSQMNIPFKKRKLFNRGSGLKSDGGINGDGFFDSPEDRIGDGPGSCPKLRGGLFANHLLLLFGLSILVFEIHYLSVSTKIINNHYAGTGKSSSIAGQRASFQSRDSHVKLRIKSFRVPEVFIEIPETATIGSLKRSVMEAVTEILGGGLHIGVLLQGKKVRDDNKTLLQTGISHHNQLDALGFTLEPSPLQNPPPICPGDSPRLLPGDPPQPLARYTPNPIVDHQEIFDVTPEPHAANLGNFVESDHDSAPSPSNMSANKSTTDSKALVPVPAMSVEALAAVPMHRKSKRSDIAQRRIRRPFSVTEVEALVLAVEKLGTGRWRDVKLRAFDNAKHRTYVDLKDKWKTLVHTARISPQQRRGEPVPQELLDRVLAAHAYWSQQQAKQQLKQHHQPDTTCLLL